MSIRVKIESEYVFFPDQQPRLVNGKTLVPAFPVFNHLGYDVHWEPGIGSGPRGELVIRKGNDIIRIKESMPYFTVNNKIFFHTDNVSAQIIGGRIMIPIRSVLESIGYIVDWDDTTDTVIVTTNIEGYYRIKNSNGKYLTYSSPVKSDDSITVTDNNNSDTQIWKIERLTDSSKYHIKPAQSMILAMNIFQSDPYPCTIFTTSNNEGDTSFNFEPVTNTGYYIKWKDGNETRYLIDAGTETYWSHIGNPQGWTLEPASYTMTMENAMSYPVENFTGIGRTYDTHAPNARDLSTGVEGYAIYATMAGTVTEVVMSFANDYNYDPEKGTSTGGATADIVGQMASYGNYIIIQVDMDGSVLIYAHQQQSDYVKKGDKVFAGQQIGKVGDTGCSSGPHLHFEVLNMGTIGNTVFDYFVWK